MCERVCGMWRVDERVWCVACVRMWRVMCMRDRGMLFVSESV